MDLSRRRKAIVDFILMTADNEGEGIVMKRTDIRVAWLSAAVCVAALWVCVFASDVALAGGPKSKDKTGKPGEKNEDGSAPAISFEEPAEGGDTAVSVNPFGGGTVRARKDAVPGYVELSTGLKVPGKIFTTRGKRIKIFDLKAKKYRQVPLPAVKSIVSEVEWERMERKWYFANPGDPTKTYTGKKYPARKHVYAITLLNNKVIRGHISFGALIYVQVSEKEKAKRFILHDRDKGKVGQTLKDLVYVKEVRLGKKAYEVAVEEAKKKAAEAKKKAEQKAKGVKKGEKKGPTKKGGRNDKESEKNTASGDERVLPKGEP